MQRLVVEEVNGEGGEEIGGFVPTRNELLQLAQYWAKEVLQIELYFFYESISGSTEWRIQEFATHRLSRIGKLIGAETVSAAAKEVYDDVGKGHDKKAWEVFMNGDDAQVKAFQEGYRKNTKADEIDWAWIDQETQLHRNGDCSFKS